MMTGIAKKTYLAAFMLFHLTACFDGEDDYEQLVSNMSGLSYLCSGGLRSVGDDVITYEDLQDGMISKTVVTPMRENCRGDSTETQIIYFKKCLQGQVYRTAENDCQGTGSVDDNWSAAKYQFCPTNDEACNLPDEGVADPAKSPAAIACAEDTTAGKEWKLVGNVYRGTDHLFPNNILSIMPDIPTGDDEFIWKEFQYDATRANTYRFEPDGSFQVGAHLNNTYQYVLCVTEREITTEAAK